MEDLPGAVLFACNLNAVRSPVAAALMRHRFGGRVFVESCGLRPAAAIDPFVAAIMAERGFDLSAHRPQGFEDVTDGSFDLVISLTPEAHHRATELTRGRATELEYWPAPDPAEAEGSREQRFEAYREMRDALARRIMERFPVPPVSGG